MTKKKEDPDHISKKKEAYSLKMPLLDYLKKYDRTIAFPISYDDLMRFTETLPVYDAKTKKDTLWATALYPAGDIASLYEGLKQIYAILKTGGDSKVHKHLDIERVDFCTFGNTHPFRIKIVNNFNDVYDYFYIKKTDSSRIFGLELEDILSPSRINFFANENCLVEEHIAGIPGDMFIKNHLHVHDYNLKRIAKEFVKFNERCFVRLLGDMRSYNYVVDVTPDFEEAQFRIRAIDFDQQCYEGRKNLYLPQFFKENQELVALVQKHFNKNVVQQYQQEERTLMARRIIASKEQLSELLKSLENEPLSQPDKIRQLKSELFTQFNMNANEEITTMAQIVKKVLENIAEISL